MPGQVDVGANFTQSTAGHSLDVTKRRPTCKLPECGQGHAAARFGQPVPFSQDMPTDEGRLVVQSSAGSDNPTTVQAAITEKK